MYSSTVLNDRSRRAWFAEAVAVDSQETHIDLEAYDFAGAGAIPAPRRFGKLIHTKQTPAESPDDLSGNRLYC